MSEGSKFGSSLICFGSAGLVVINIMLSSVFSLEFILDGLAFVFYLDFHSYLEVRFIMAAIMLLQREQQICEKSASKGNLHAPWQPPG